MRHVSIYISSVIIVLSGILAMGNSKDIQKDSTDFTRLWKEYESTSRADNPMRSLRILEQIKELAKEKRDPWEFHRAGIQYYRTASQRNWKLRDCLWTTFQEEIISFDEPILTFFNRKDDREDRTDFLKANKDVLKAGHNTGFYRASPPNADEFTPVLEKLLRNDYEYALWYVYLTRWTDGRDGVKALLDEETGDSYPLAQFMEFTECRRSEDTAGRIDKLKAFENKYRGKAVAMLATQAILFDEFNRMDKASSEDYTRFREKCAGTERARKAFKGSEAEIAECCTRIKDLIEIMDSQSMKMNVSDGQLTLIIRNLEKVNLELKQEDRSIFRTTLRNQAGSYYVEDTVRYILPVVNDGRYDLICSEGKLREEAVYEKYTVSMSKKRDSRGHHVYAVQSVSGRPLDNARVSVVDEKQRELADADMLDFTRGFVRLPDKLQSLLNEDKTRSLICTYTDDSGLRHSSTELTEYGRFGSQNQEDREVVYGTLFTDRSAFNPDETVRFKGIVYCGNMAEHLHILEGEEIEVRLRNTDGKIVDTRRLQTNDFGSVAGEFDLKRGEKNGIYTLELIHKGEEIAFHNIRVDDFVLPSFELTFEPDTTLNLAGDDICVKGQILSYSGHSLTGADVSYSILKSGREYDEGSINVCDDGGFEIKFRTGDQDYQYFSITVKVVDNTGETLTWSTDRRTYDSIPFHVEIKNPSKGSVEMKSSPDLRWNESYGQYIISDDRLDFRTDVKEYRSGSGIRHESMTIEYKLLADGRQILSGRATPGQDVSLDLSRLGSGLYTLEAECSCRRRDKKELVSRSRSDVLLVRDEDTSVDADVENVFRVIDGDRVGLMFGTSAGPTWANIDLYGTGDILLAHRFVELSGKRAHKGSLERILFEWKEDWPDVAEINILYFRNNRCHSFSHQFERRTGRLELPLAFSRIEDRTRPGSEYHFEIGTAPHVECAAAIFDKSSETIMPNQWNPVGLLRPQGPTVDNLIVCGRNGTARRILYKSGGVMAQNANVIEDIPMTYNAVEAAGVMMDSALENEEEAQDTGMEVKVRENFANTIMFEPFLKADSEGKIGLDFKTADKLSTYCVQLFAHDKEMRNSTIRSEIVVTVPVKVSVVEPQFLYTGDLYTLKASVSSNVPEEVKGRLSVEWYDGDRMLERSECGIRLKPYGSDSGGFSIKVPHLDRLGIKISFAADSIKYGTDAIYTRVPVMPSTQTVREAHSAILHSGESRAELINSLRKMFVNVPADSTVLSERSLLDMAIEAIPSHIEPASKNVLDMSGALYSRNIARKISARPISVVTTDKELVGNILACQNDDGGFSWFTGMRSSPAITASILARIASMRRYGSGNDAFSEEIIKNAVEYMDKSYLGDKRRPYWCGGISFSQYVSVRASFCEVAFNTAVLDKEAVKTFRKDIKDYLVPSKERGLNGMVFGKARRMRVIFQLLESDSGLSLAENWGIRISSKRRLDRSLEADFRSLLEYAVEHKSGGWYFPNAVMPYRGLLESEAYAHVFICDIIEDCAGKYDYDGPSAAPSAIADGIRLWLMVQKENQKWDESPEYAEALATISGGSESILSTKILSLDGAKQMPFETVRESGNGMKIKLCWYVMDRGSQWKELKEGESIKVGQVIKAEYKIWNEENRSFIKVTAPRIASLRPIEQLSGHIGWWLRPIAVNGGMSYTPQGYRSVLSDRTEYWFDTYPEEHSTISEEFYVTQSGKFQMPVLEIESLYATHYRANDYGHAPVLCE